MGTAMRALLRDETAAASVCYGIVVALVALTLIVSLQGLGNSLNSTYSVASSEPAQSVRCVEVGSNCNK